MSGPLTLPEACQALGLACRCEHLPGEPRFSIDLDHHASEPRLVLTLRGDGAIAPAVVHCDDAVPGLLLCLEERSLQREPVMDLWLPDSRAHRYVVYRDATRWRVASLRDDATPTTVREALDLLDDPDG